MQLLPSVVCPAANTPLQALSRTTSWATTSWANLSVMNLFNTPVHETGLTNFINNPAHPERACMCREEKEKQEVEAYCHAAVAFIAYHLPPSQHCLPLQVLCSWAFCTTISVLNLFNTPVHEFHFNGPTNLINKPAYLVQGGEGEAGGGGKGAGAAAQHDGRGARGVGARKPQGVEPGVGGVGTCGHMQCEQRFTALLP